MCKDNISRRLAQLRAARGVTQEEVAAALSVSNKTISKWENGASAPDLAMLAALSMYYGVTTDYLLGLEAEKKDMKSVVRELFHGLNLQESVLRLFEVIEATFSPVFRASADAGHGDGTLLPGAGKPHRNRIAIEELFSYEICSDDVNMAVVQLQNRSDFGWLFDPEKQAGMVKLFAFLADADALKILACIHSDACTTHFTVSWMSKTAQVPSEKTEAVLEKCCGFGLCEKKTALLKEGETVVYASLGDGVLLCILSLAYETMWGAASCFYWNNTSTYKMIRKGS